jgi:hypothetical protein
MVGPEDVSRVDVAKELQLAHEDNEEPPKVVGVACLAPAFGIALLLDRRSTS